MTVVSDSLFSCARTIPPAIIVTAIIIPIKTPLFTE